MTRSRGPWLLATKNNLNQLTSGKPTPIRVKMKHAHGEPPRVVHGLFVAAPESITMLGEDAVALTGEGRVDDEERYEQLLARVINDIGHAGTTTSTELASYMNSVMPGRFAGVFAASQGMPLNSTRCYAIVNTTDAPGEHWLGVMKLRSGGMLVYDSYGRRVTLVNARHPYSMTEDDAEQTEEEDNCGQRVCAWLMLAEERGAAAAKRI